MITLLGHVCIDHNRIDNGPLIKQWGSPLGRGDIFSIAMTMALHSGRDLDEAVQYAHEEVRHRLLAVESKTMIQ